MSVARLVSRLASLSIFRQRPTIPASISITKVPASSMPVATRSPPPDEPAAKRIKIDTETTCEAPLSKKMSKAQAKAQAKEASRPPGVSFRPRDDVPTAEELAAIEEIMASEIEHPKSYAHEVEYRDKLVLAPMVRTGTLPTRLLSLYYGAGLVWSPEIVDKAIIGAERSVDPETGVITYHKGQGPIFTCHPIEKPFLIFQIGSSNPELAVQAARVVAQDVAGIDLNCGCPKPFSTHSGMGAALLSTPDLLLDILRALLSNIPLPISAKIRLLPTRAETMHLAARILKTGVRNLTVHCRTRDMRPREKAIHERLAEVVQLGNRRGVSVTCNGDGEGWENWKDIKGATGADSLMIARAAEENPSCFAPTLADPTTVVVPQLLSWVSYTGHNWGNTKFLLSQFKATGPILDKHQRKEAMQAVARGKSVAEVTELLNKVVPIEVSAEKGKAFMAELEAKLRAREEWGRFEAVREKRDADVAAALDAAAAAKATAEVEAKVEGEGEKEAAAGETAQAEIAEAAPATAETEAVVPLITEAPVDAAPQPTEESEAPIAATA